MFSGTVAEMAEIEALLAVSALAKDFKLAATKYAAKDFAMLDVLPPGCTKGAALAEWAKLQGLQRERDFGDWRQPQRRGNAGVRGDSGGDGK